MKFLLPCLFLFTLSLSAQETPAFTRQDTLRGSITPQRSWWDLTFYDLHLTVNPADSSIAGYNVVRYKTLKPGQELQIDLQPPMVLTRAGQDEVPLTVRREGNAHFIQLKNPAKTGQSGEIRVWFEGKPQVSKRPPWSGGITWAKDDNGLPWVVSTCQGDGASLWWPCKDHAYDEPDSMRMTVTVPEPLRNISNGRQISESSADGWHTSVWAVRNPINNYGVNINIGDYVHFGEKYAGEKGELDCDYYVLRDHLKMARTHFREVPRMLEAFEYWFGPYPFYEDSFKLVDVPYPGMEHQSSVTYGNDYKNGYKGKDVSGTGWGFNFDFIIIHESGHEWFANNITAVDVADLWIQEGFTAYSENLFLDYFYGKKAACEYAIGTRKNILNDRPVIGPYNVNRSGSHDMYSKGANLLHTLRMVVDDDELWRQILRGLNRDFYHRTVTSAQVEAYIAEKSGRKLGPVFDQYLREKNIPELKYYWKNGALHYRWSNCLPTFNMPVRVSLNGQDTWLQASTAWQELAVKDKGRELIPDPNFYVTAQDLDALQSGADVSR